MCVAPPENHQSLDWHVAGVGPVGITDVQELKMNVSRAADSETIDVGAVHAKKTAGFGTPSPPSAGQNISTTAKASSAATATPRNSATPSNSAALPPRPPPVTTAAHGVRVEGSADPTPVGVVRHRISASDTMYDDFTGDSPQKSHKGALAGSTAANDGAADLTPEPPPRTSSRNGNDGPSNGPGASPVPNHVFTDDESDVVSEDGDDAPNAAFTPPRRAPPTVNTKTATSNAGDSGDECLHSFVSDGDEDEVEAGPLQAGRVLSTKYGDAYVMDKIRTDHFVQLHLGWGQMFYYVPPGDPLAGLLPTATPAVARTGRSASTESAGSLPGALPDNMEPQSLFEGGTEEDEASVPAMGPVFLQRVKGVENVDLSNIVTGHLEYRTKLEPIFTAIGFGRDLSTVTTLRPTPARKTGISAACSGATSSAAPAPASGPPTKPLAQ